MKILGIPGSIRKRSYNRALLEAAITLLPPNVTMEIHDLSLLPLYNDDLAAQKPPNSVLSFRDHIKTSNSLWIASPEYNYSITGVLKNALDWAATNTISNLLVNKTVAIMGASRSNFGTVRSQLHLRQILFAAGAHVIQKPEVHIRRAQDLVSAHGAFKDERTLIKIRALLDAIILDTA